MTCVSWERAGRPAIFWHANPADVSWNMAQRSEEQKTKSGTVLHVWRDRQRRTFFDEPVLTFNFQSGNILPIREAFLEILETDTSPPPGLSNFYEFLALVDEIKVLEDGQPNFVKIRYSSLIFPMIELQGFFTPNGVQFADRSDNHAEVNNWTAAFTVYKSTPELGRAIATANEALADGSAAGQQLQAQYREYSKSIFSDRRSEDPTGLLEDFAQTIRAAARGDLTPRDIAAAGRATVASASRINTVLKGADLLRKGPSSVRQTRLRLPF